MIRRKSKKSQSPSLHGHVTTKLPVFGPETTVSEALRRFKTESYDESNDLFVVEPSGKLIGNLPLGDLIRHEPDETLGSLVQPCSWISVNNSLEFAANHALSEQIQSVPVVDREEKFLGVLSTRILIETLRREHVEDIHRLAGIQKEKSDVSEAIDEPPIRSVWHRLPWLLAGLAGSFLATFIMASFEKTLDGNIALAFFIPAIVYLADAIGTQTETIVIRGLSLSMGSFLKALRREFLTGLMIGIILALVSLPVALLGGYGWQISVVVALSIVAAGTMATTIGMLLPWLILKMGKDPAFGSGPLATIIQDILSILVFFLIASAVLGGF